MRTSVVCDFSRCEHVGDDSKRTRGTVHLFSKHLPTLMMMRPAQIVRLYLRHTLYSNQSHKCSTKCAQMYLRKRVAVSRLGEISYCFGDSPLKYRHKPKLCIISTGPHAQAQPGKELRTSDILEPKGVPNNYVLYVLAVIC